MSMIKVLAGLIPYQGCEKRIHARLSGWLVDGGLLLVSTYHLPSVHAQVYIFSFYIDISHIRLRSTSVTLF
jgi:hypothetical protein